MAVMLVDAAEGAVGPCRDVHVPPSQRPRVLVRGAVHPAVRDAQRRLNAFHAQELMAGRGGVDDAPLAEDCIFGPHTLKAVLSFQRQVFPDQPNEHDGKIGPKTWAQLDKLPSGAFPPPLIPGAPSIVIPSPVIELPPDIILPSSGPQPAGSGQQPARSRLCDAIADVAEREFARWRAGGSTLHETDAAATPILQQYYREGVATEVSATELQSQSFQSAHPWSAVFVSFCMRAAGAGSRFAYSHAHQGYIRAARRNRLAGDIGNPFWAFRPTEAAPLRGDLVCQSRSDSGATLDNIADPTFRATHCDIVTRVQPNEIRTVGGNVGQTVDAKRFRTDATGHLMLDGTQSRFFAIVTCDGPVAGTVPVPGQIPTPARPPLLPPAQAGGPAPAPAPVPGPIRPTVDGRILQVMQLLVDRYDYPVNGAAGLVGNLMAESAVQPNRIEGSASATPMRAPAFVGGIRDFSADEVMNRSSSAMVGPRLPGIGLAQWTTSARRRGLFQHAFNGQVLGRAILESMEGQVDYLVTELQTSFRGVNGVIRNPGVTVDAAADEVVYRFEVPAAILDENRQLRPRSNPAVQAVFRARRAQAARALLVFRASHPA